MSGTDIDRTLAAWFADDAQAPAPAGAFERAMVGVRRHRPRPALLAVPGSTWGRVAPTVGSSVAVPTLIAVVLLGVLLGGLALAGAALVELPPHPTARSGALAYALDGDIYLADGDGTDPVRIADGLPGGRSGCGPAGYWAEGPMWSPDGRWLTYRSPRSQVDCDRPEADTIPAVVLADPTGNVVASVPGVGWDIPWSADSSRFATWLDLYPMTTIGVYGIDGVQQARLSVPPGAQPEADFDPIWSRDGRSLLVLDFGSSLGRLVGWEVPIDGRVPGRLPNGDPRTHWWSAYAPDGRQFAYIDGKKMYIVTAGDPEPRDLVSGVDTWTNAAWSPTGDRIAYVAGSGRLLRVVDVASGSIATVASLVGEELTSIIDFSPAGDRILFARHDERLESQSLWSVGVDGSEPRLLVSGTTIGDWQPIIADP